MPVDAALSEARTAIWISLPNTLEWGTPVLYLRSPDGKLFDLVVQPPLPSQLVPFAAQQHSTAEPPVPASHPAAPPPVFRASDLIDKSKMPAWMSQDTSAPAEQQQSAVYAPVPQKTREQWIREGIGLRLAERYAEALTAFEQAIALDPAESSSWFGKGLALWDLKRREEATAPFNQAFSLPTKDAPGYYLKSAVLVRLQRRQEALKASEQALKLDSKLAVAWYGKGNVLLDLQQQKKAVEAYEQALKLDPTLVWAWNGKGNALWSLGKRDEAKEAFDQALKMNPKLGTIWHNKGLLIMQYRGHFMEYEADEAFKKARELGYSE